MRGRLVIEYREGGSVTTIEREVGDDWLSMTKPYPNRDELAEALTSASGQLLDAAKPKGAPHV